MGRIIFNWAIPQNLGWLDRTKRENYCQLEVNQVVAKGDLSKITELAFKNLGTTATSTMLDKIKATGFKYSTISSLTINTFDMHETPEKEKIIAEAQSKVIVINS